MAQRTPLYQAHLDAGAKMVDFGGWDMPIHYGSQVEEHHQVRQTAGVFDVSHMTVVDVSGRDATVWLQRLLANDVTRLQTSGKALYTAMLNDDGGVLDDLIVYRMHVGYRLVVNCATREQDLAWMRQQLGDAAVELTERQDLAMVAVQGPQARQKTAALLPEDWADLVLSLSPFEGCPLEKWFVARTGYTGEDGFEIMLPEEQVAEFWQRLLDNEIRPCGLGARDTLRLEAGMNLYGVDMDTTVTPLECGMGWTVAWNPAERDFIGRKALEAQRLAGHHRRQIALVMRTRGVLRGHQPVLVEGEVVGEITSGTFSPTIGCAIAFARVRDVPETGIEVEIRNRRHEVERVKAPFVRHGEVLV